MREPPLDQDVVQLPCRFNTRSPWEGVAARPPKFGRQAPNAAWWRAEGVGPDGEGASRAIINVSAMRVIFGHYSKNQIPDFTAHTSSDFTLSSRQRESVY